MRLMGKEAWEETQRMVFGYRGPVEERAKSFADWTWDELEKVRVEARPDNGFSVVGADGPARDEFNRLVDEFAESFKYKSTDLDSLRQIGEQFRPNVVVVVPRADQFERRWHSGPEHDTTPVLRGFSDEQIRREVRRSLGLDDIDIVLTGNVRETNDPKPPYERQKHWLPEGARRVDQALRPKIDAILRTQHQRRRDELKHWRSVAGGIVLLLAALLLGWAGWVSYPFSRLGQVCLAAIVGAYVLRSYRFLQQRKELGIASITNRNELARKWEALDKPSRSSVPVKTGSSAVNPNPDFAGRV
jgi:hypothetical protein